MNELNQVSWKQLEKFLFAVGCEFVGQVGSHRKYKKAGLRRPVMVPARARVPIHVILSNLRTLGISKEECTRIIDYDINLRGALKKEGFLKRDPRAKERRKRGLVKARKRKQWSKR